jgi:Tfp pilus assembly protein PilF
VVSFTAVTLSSNIEVYNMKINLLGLSLFLFLSTFATPVFAANVFQGQEPNTLYANFIDALDKIKSADHSILEITSLYKDLESEAIYYEGYINNGSSTLSDASTTLYDSKSVVTHEVTTKRGIYSTPMNLITKSGDIYLSFPDAKSKSIKNKWTKVTKDQYNEIGEKLGLTVLFEGALLEEGPLARKLRDISVKLARKHNLYSHFTEGFEDDISVENATRYDLVYNASALTAYFDDLKDTLTAEEKNASIFALNGVERSLADPEYVEEVANHSFISLWVDNTTQQPVRMWSVLILPPNRSQKEYVVSESSITLSNINVPITITPPHSTLGVAEMAKALKIKLAGKNDAALKRIADLKKQLTKAKKVDRGNIAYSVAVAYDDIDDTKGASEYYKKAAAYYPKNSVDQYDALARSEWQLGNGQKVKEYYELALGVDPDSEFVLNNYGWFLTGLSPVSATYQDLSRALSINTQLVKKVVDDSTLINLYATYVLMGRTKEAEELKKKFDNFESAQNSNSLARLYHRLGNKKLEDYYAKLAKDNGYVRSVLDEVFFKMSF